MWGWSNSQEKKYSPEMWEWINSRTRLVGALRGVSRGRGVEGSRPEWYISSMLYSRDTPVWSGTLEIFHRNVRVNQVTGETIPQKCERINSREKPFPRNVREKQITGDKHSTEMWGWRTTHRRNIFPRNVRVNQLTDTVGWSTEGSQQGPWCWGFPTRMVYLKHVI